MAFLNALDSFVPNLPILRKTRTKQARKRGYVSENKLSDPRVLLGGFELEYLLQSFLVLQLLWKILQECGGAKMRESENVEWSE
jgi:hypothetical protein